MKLENAKPTYRFPLTDNNDKVYYINVIGDQIPSHIPINKISELNRDCIIILSDRVDYTAIVHGNNIYVGNIDLHTVDLPETIDKNIRQNIDGKWDGKYTDVTSMIRNIKYNTKTVHNLSSRNAKLQNIIKSLFKLTKRRIDDWVITTKYTSGTYHHISGHYYFIVVRSSFSGDLYKSEQVETLKDAMRKLDSMPYVLAGECSLSRDKFEITCSEDFEGKIVENVTKLPSDEKDLPNEASVFDGTDVISYNQELMG